MVANVLQAPTTRVLQQFAMHLRAYRTSAATPTKALQDFQQLAATDAHAEKVKKAKLAARLAVVKFPPPPASSDPDFQSLYAELHEIYNNVGAENLAAIDPNHVDYTGLVRIAARNSKLSSDEQRIAEHTAYMLGQFRHKSSHSADQLYNLNVDELNSFIDTSVLFLKVIGRRNIPELQELLELKSDLAQKVKNWTSSNSAPATKASKRQTDAKDDQQVKKRRLEEAFEDAPSEATTAAVVKELAP